MTDKKELRIALLFNFFIPGAGHIYAGKQNGIPLLIASGVCLVLTPHLILPAVPLLAIWIYTLATTHAVVDEYNRQVEANDAKARTDAAKQITPEDFCHQISKAHQLFAAGIIDAAEFAAKKASHIQDLQFKTPNSPLKKAATPQNRHSRGSGNPFFSQAFWTPAFAGVTIEGVFQRAAKGEVDDFLLAIVPMKQANVLSEEEIAGIKKALLLKVAGV